MNFVHSADLGFNKKAVLVLNSNVDSSVNERQPAFKQQLLAIGGVQSVSFSSDMPSSQSNSSGNFSYDHKPDEKFEVYRKLADEDYFKTFGLIIIAGRVYSKSDTLKEVVVNETLVKRYFQNEESLGKRLEIGFSTPPAWREIVGVVADVHSDGLDQDTPVQVYTAYFQQPGFLAGVPPAFTVLARTAQDPALLGAPMKGAILKVDHSQPVYAVQPMTALAPSSFRAQMLARCST